MRQLGGLKNYRKKHMPNRKMDKALLELMVLTMEECGELTQACSKVLRRYEKTHEIEEKYSKQLLEEVGDVYCMIELLHQHGLIDWYDMKRRVETKREKLKIWSDLIE